MKSLLSDSSLEDISIPLSSRDSSSVLELSRAPSAKSTASSDEEKATPKAPAHRAKYKRRRRVYEKIKPEYRYKKLETVIEGQELRNRNSWWGQKVTAILLTLFICIAGLKETTRMIQETKDEALKPEDKLNRVERGNVTNQETGSEDENDSEEDINELTEIPDKLRYLANIEDPALPTDRAFFWHIPRSGGATVKLIVSQCFKLTVASEQGASDVSDKISIISDLEGNQYINVDTYTAKGLEHAKDLSLTTFPRVDLIATPLIYDVSEQILSNDYRGRCFTLMRHPVDREVSFFHTHKAVLFEGMTIDDYAESDSLQPNWMTRVLSNTLEDELTTNDLEIAKHVLQERCVVGLLRSKGESMRRIEAYFGWKLDGEVSISFSSFS
mmetsp:Transcript_5803/g.9158  ORF Transcript_5803/g.9158 Transcript_5803/m.9158 type:complete len:385 (-) Transcript_5803:1857-3011(-)